MTFGTGTVGEVNALRALNHGSATNEQWASVENGLWFPGLIVLVGLILHIVRQGEGEERERAGLAVLLVTGTVFAVIMSVFVPQPFF
jgi:hypothetical protein